MGRYMRSYEQHQHREHSERQDRERRIQRDHEFMKQHGMVNDDEHNVLRPSYANMSYTSCRITDITTSAPSSAPSSVTNEDTVKCCVIS